MELKYNIGDEVFVKGTVKSIKVEKGCGDKIDIIYNLSIPGAYSSAVRITELEDDIHGSVDSGVPTSELRNLYKEMANVMRVKDKNGDPVTNVLDSCRVMLLDVIEAYERKSKPLAYIFNSLSPKDQADIALKITEGCEFAKEVEE